MNDVKTYFEMIYARAKEVQPNIKLLVQDFEASGMEQEDILLEISVALIHEGYRLHELKNGIKVNSAQGRTLQTHVDQNKQKE